MTSKLSLTQPVYLLRYPRAQGTSEPGISLLKDQFDDIFSNMSVTAAIYPAIIKNY